MNYYYYPLLLYFISNFYYYYPPFPPYIPLYIVICAPCYVVCALLFLLYVSTLQHGRSDSYRVATIPSIPDDNKTADGKAKVVTLEKKKRYNKNESVLIRYILGGSLYVLYLKDAIDRFVFFCFFIHSSI